MADNEEDEYGGGQNNEDESDQEEEEEEKEDEVINEGEQQGDVEKQELNEKLTGLDAVNFINYVKILCFVVALFELIFAEYLCMFRNVCTVNGIEIYEAWLGESILYFMFLTIILMIFCYYLIMTLNDSYIFRFQVLMLFYCILVVVFGIIALNSGRQVSDEKIQSVWNQLSEVSKSYFENDIAQLTSENQRNLIQVGIYHIISGILIFGIVVQLNRLYDRLKDKDKDKPDIEKLMDQHINPGVYDDGMILIKYRQNQKKRRDKRKKLRLENEDKKNYNQQDQNQQLGGEKHILTNAQNDRKRKQDKQPVTDVINKNGQQYGRN